MSITSTVAMMSRSDDATADDDFASFLASVPATLSREMERIRNSNDDDGGDGMSIRVIMGNEAGDADSIVSALGLAYVLSREEEVASSAKVLEGDKEMKTMVVPVVSVPRADISLRRDVILLLDLAGVDVDDLLYLDDDIVTRHLLPPPAAVASSKTPPVTLTLVDHNRIRSSLSHLSSSVTYILDHHEDEGDHNIRATADSGTRTIAFEDGRATVASTCTLVAERMFRRKQDDSVPAKDDQSTNTISIDGSLGLMLLGVILLDSVNMLPAAGKGMARDEEAMRSLMERTDWVSASDDCGRGSQRSRLVDAAALDKIFPDDGNGKPDRTALFEALSGAKNDPRFWLGLSTTDRLRIDYKRFSVPTIQGRPASLSSPARITSIGLSSVLVDADTLLSREGFRDDLAEFVKSSDVGLFGILAVTFGEGGGPRREMLLTGPDPGIVDSFATFLLEHPDAAFLEIAEREAGDDNGANDDDARSVVRVFRQGNGKGSRKQVAPILLGHAAGMN